ncbi:MAG TPA: hypothetical protein H9898_03600 [Candidatus Anaerobiospirillum stercoravium]|nr:hypothetical protein [Candidatus Anaerobiospirillum stercoravium]
MRNSNHAIKFLLAQYRAIFKRAYIKGLASAVLLTAGLAAGQAQAATDALTDATKLPLNSGDQVLIDGSTTPNDNKYDALQISGGTQSFNGTITISSGTAKGSGNYFKGSSELKITGDGTITIKTADTTQGLAIIGSGNNTTSLDIGTINLNQGTLLVTTNKDNGGNVSAAADIVTVGTATAATQERTALLTLRANADGKTVTFGNENSDITVNGNGRLDLEATSGSITISGAALTLNNGAFMLTTNSGGKLNTSGTISVDTYTINSDASHVISGSDSKYVTEIFNGQTANFAGNLLIASGNTWQLEPTIPAKEAERVSGAGFVTLADGSNTVVGGTITVNSGTLTVAEGAKLHASGTAGVIEVLDASDTSDSVLTISSNNLTRFLTGKDTADSGSTYTEIKADGTLGEANKATGASGAIVLSGGRLELTDTTPIELNTFSFKAIDGTDGTKGVISFHSGSANTIYAQDLVLKGQLKSGDDTISANKNLWLESHTLTLGDSSKQDRD